MYIYEFPTNYQQLAVLVELKMMWVESRMRVTLEQGSHVYFVCFKVDSLKVYICVKKVLRSSMLAIVEIRLLLRILADTVA